MEKKLFDILKERGLKFVKGINKVILDLRGNGGGYVTAAKDLLSLWIDGDVVLKQKSKHLGDSETRASGNKATLKGKIILP